MTETESSLAASVPVSRPTAVDQEAGGGKQLHCRVCLRSDGRDLISPCKCEGTSKFVHRDCLNYSRAVKERFAFTHCTACKVPYYLKAHICPDRKWKILKLLKFRYILFIFAVIQLVICALANMCFLVVSVIRYNSDVYIYYPYYLRQFSWSSDLALRFYYASGVLLFCIVVGLSGCYIIFYKRRMRSGVSQSSCQDLPTFSSETGWNRSTARFVNTTVQYVFIEEADLVWLGMLFAMELFVIGLVTSFGIYYSIIAASFFGQQIWKHHYYIIAKGMLAKEYVVEDMHGEVKDWCPPPLLPEHVQELRELGLYL
ncbi:hypothetical protein Cni_G11438 [Canna indica]|uniref:RING-CH-type domain-containing protein n=1 Tax=Canna indica TaxID=4628 RepID=A0AAQ3K7S7_9LILI|nr:hypothetical protein Cni_G11438 [Canna indica]